MLGHQFPGGVAGAGVEPMAPGGSGIGVQTSVAGGSSSAVPLSCFVSFPSQMGATEALDLKIRSLITHKKGQSRWFGVEIQLVFTVKVNRRVASRS